MESEHIPLVGRPSRTDQHVPIRVGLIGCGRVAEYGYLPAFTRAQGVMLAGIADINVSRCRALAPDVAAFRDIQSLIQAGGIDALVISVPTRFHLEYARMAAKAGIPSLVEKPPGIDLQEARALQALQPTPWIAFNRRFEPGLIALKQAIPRAHGFALHLELQYRRTTWKPFDMHDDALLDLGPHLIDLTLWLSETTVRSVRTFSLDEGHAEFELELKHGRAVVACSTNRLYRERMEITDADGRLRASHRRGGIVRGILARLRRNDENTLVSSMVRQLEALGHAVRGSGEEPHLASAAEGVAVMSVIEAVRRSAAERNARVFIAESAQGDKS